MACNASPVASSPSRSCVKASITSMAFAAKLDAITDCYKQDKKVLYKALSLIQKYEAKEKY